MADNEIMSDAPINRQNTFYGGPKEFKDL